MAEEEKIIHWCGTCEHMADYFPEEEWVICEKTGVEKMVSPIPKADECPDWKKG